MQTRLSPEFKQTADGAEAEAILRKCVHCGFCNATCPTYQLLGDELDGPRGRIYLIKQVLEGAPATRSTQQHLDRCLTCRNCETTCPSGVEFGRLVDIGRELIDARVTRPPVERAARWLLKRGLTSSLFAAAVKIGSLLRPLLPRRIAAQLPPGGASAAGARTAPAGARNVPASAPAPRVLLLGGCVQPALAPNINAATLRVLQEAGIECRIMGGCCGAIRSHLGDHDAGLADARRNIDAWWPAVAGGGIEAIVSNASACALAIKDYGRALARDERYAAKAAAVSALARDLCELLPRMLPALGARLAPPGEPAGARRLAFHPPCTLQHGQRLGGVVEAHLKSLGFDMATCPDSHLCCGSAGTYSVLQPALAHELRDRKLANLATLQPQCIVSANIGCIHHLQAGTATPVRHWVEILGAALD